MNTERDRSCRFHITPLVKGSKPITRFALQRSQLQEDSVERKATERDWHEEVQGHEDHLDELYNA